MAIRVAVAISVQHNFLSGQDQYCLLARRHNLSPPLENDLDCERSSQSSCHRREVSNAPCQTDQGNAHFLSKAIGTVFPCHSRSKT